MRSIETPYLSLLLLRGNRPISGFGEKRFPNHHHIFLYLLLSLIISSTLSLSFASAFICFGILIKCIAGIWHRCLYTNTFLFRQMRNRRHSLFEWMPASNTNKILLNENKVISQNVLKTANYLHIGRTHCGTFSRTYTHTHTHQPVPFSSIHWIHTDYVFDMSRFRSGFWKSIYTAVAYWATTKD